jgi:prepilin-type N-terminal cleavage/methylation domain-containing protein
MNRKGVTLIELLIVASIAGAIVAVALPAFSNGLENIRLSEGSDGVAAFLNSALNRVERREQVMELTISPHDNLILLRSADGAFSRRFTLPDGILVDAVLPKAPEDTGVPRHFMLLPGGSAPRIGVQLANRRGQRRIVSLDPITGVPTIERPANP